MNLVAKLLAVSAIAISFAANAQDSAPRKTVVLDTGKGGAHLVVSVPNFADGPYDFYKNPGVAKTINGDWNHQSVMFNAQVGETGVVVYQAVLDKISKRDDRKQNLTAEHAASEMLANNGFTPDRATKIGSPQVPIPGATVVTYKASGYSVFNEVEKSGKLAFIVMAVSFANDTQSYALMATVFEKNIAAFDADPAKFEHRAMKAFTDMFQNSSAVKN